MSATAGPAALGPTRAARRRSRRKAADRLGDRALYAVCLFAVLLSGAVIVLIAYQVVHGASPAISKFGLGFLTDTTWQPNFGEFGAGSLIFGTAISSFAALFLGAPIAGAIGRYLSMLAP
jgi:phosphate transport system permease protein